MNNPDINGTDKLDELLATRSTLEEALRAADGIDSAEAREIRGAMAAIDDVMAPIREAEAALDGAPSILRCTSRG